MDEVNRVKEGRQPERQLVSEKTDIHNKEQHKSASKEAKKESKHETTTAKVSNSTSKPVPDKSNLSVQTDL